MLVCPVSFLRNDCPYSYCYIHQCISPISYVHTYIECIHIHIIISPISYIHTYYIECIYILHIETIHRDLKGHGCCNYYVRCTLISILYGFTYLPNTCLLLTYMYMYKKYRCVPYVSLTPVLVCIYIYICSTYMYIYCYIYIGIIY